MSRKECVFLSKRKVRVPINTKYKKDTKTKKNTGIPESEVLIGKKGILT